MADRHLETVRSALLRAHQLCAVTAQDHDVPDLHRAVAGVRHEVRTALEALLRLDPNLADLPVPGTRSALTLDHVKGRQLAARDSRKHAVLTILRDHGPQTDSDLAAALGLPRLYVTPRRSELVWAGYVEPVLDDLGNPVTVVSQVSSRKARQWQVTTTGRLVLDHLDTRQLALAN